MGFYLSRTPDRRRLGEGGQLPMVNLPTFAVKPLPTAITNSVPFNTGIKQAAIEAAAAQPVLSVPTTATITQADEERIYAWKQQQAALTSQSAGSQVSTPATPKVTYTPTASDKTPPTQTDTYGNPLTNKTPVTPENAYPTETTTGPKSPTDLGVPTQPTTTTGPTTDRGLYTPTFTQPNGLPSAEMTGGGDNRVMFDEIMTTLNRCCPADGAAAVTTVLQPGIEADECKTTPIGDPNSLLGRATIAIRNYTELAAANPVAAEQWLDQAFPVNSYGSASGGAGADMERLQFNKIVRDYVSGALIEWNLATNWGLCWPLHAKYIRPATSADVGGNGMNDAGGVYVDGARLAVAALQPVKMLAQMAFELAEAMRRHDDKAYGPTGSGSQAAGGSIVPVWPAGGVGWRNPSDSLKASLTLPNNIIANYLTIMRSIEADVVRARSTASICEARLQSGAGSEPGLQGYVPHPRRYLDGIGCGTRCGVGHCDPRGGQYGTSFHLGRYGRLAGTAPRAASRRADALFFALYYYARFPAIFSMVPANPSSASEIATEVNRRLEELVAYCRGLRQELYALTEAINDCEQGIAGELPPITPSPACGIPDAAGVDPNGAISSLPNPYTAEALTEGGSSAYDTCQAGGSAPDTTGSGGSGGSGGDGGGGAAPSESRSGLWMLALAAAAVGVGAVAMNKKKMKKATSRRSR